MLFRWQLPLLPRVHGHACARKFPEFLWTQSDRLFARRVIIAISLGSVFALLCYTATLLLLAFAGVLGAVISDAAAGWICRRAKIGRRFSYMVVLIGGIAIMAVALWLLVPRVAVK